MSFRERDEYKLWREQVFALFGRKCIRCGHTGNLHTHHVKAVHTYPELVFNPQNGVPLCGNCHALANGCEANFEDDLLRLQANVLGMDQEAGGADVWKADEAELRQTDEAALRQAAEEDPSNAESVKPWLTATNDSLGLVTFYRKHRDIIPRTGRICSAIFLRLNDLCTEELGDGFRHHGQMLEFYKENRADLPDDPQTYYLMVCILLHLGRIDDAIRFANAGIKRSAETTDSKFIIEALLVAGALSQQGLREQVIGFLKGVLTYEANPALGRFFRIHLELAKSYAANGDDQFRDTNASEFHIAKGLASLNRTDYSEVSSAISALGLIGGAAHMDTGLELAKRALSLSETPEQRRKVLADIGGLYLQNDSDDDAIQRCRRILAIDEMNVKAMSSIADCLYMMHRPAAARDMAKKCLLLDSTDERAHWIIEFCKE